MSNLSKSKISKKYIIDGIQIDELFDGEFRFFITHAIPEGSSLHKKILRFIKNSQNEIDINFQNTINNNIESKDYSHMIGSLEIREEYDEGFVFFETYAIYAHSKTHRDFLNFILGNQSEDDIEHQNAINKEMI